MTGVEALAVLVLARVNPDQPPDENEDAVRVGSADGVEKLRAKWALHSQQSNHSRSIAVLAIISVLVGITAAELTIDFTRSQRLDGSLEFWCDRQSCYVVGIEVGR